LITSHLLPRAAFVALAEGAGDLAAIRVLRDAQLSKHLMMLHAVAEAADGSDPGSSAFRAGYELLARIQSADTSACDWLLGLPQLGGWAHDCLIHLERGSAADFGHFACLAAAAAMRAGIPFRLEVPAREGEIRLPGLGSLRVRANSPWIHLACDGEYVSAGDHVRIGRRFLVPDDGSAAAIPEWSGTHLVRAVSGGLTWNVLLETADPYLDRYTLPMAARLTREELLAWRHRVQSAWDVLAGQHRWAADPMADGLSVIVPLTTQSDTDLVSATSPAAFGAIATSPPPDPVLLAETLVHEFQHVKLCGLLDMVHLVRPGGEPVYAPWRQDPRPVAGLLQGTYAHLGIVRFWRAQQHVESDPGDLLRAQALLARWAPAIEKTTRTLLDSGCLTCEGVRFVGLMRDRGRDLVSGAVPGEAGQLASEAALDHWLTWQLRHVAADAADVADLAAAYRRGEPGPPRTQARVIVQAEIRKVDSDARSRLLNLRYLAAARYREVCAEAVLPLSEPDRLLLARSSADAVRAYCRRIAGSADSQPDAWIGLTLALHQLPASPLQRVFATHLPIMFELHARLGGRADPLDLARWFA
jgi:HEXXH motif-containing protein